MLNHNNGGSRLALPGQIPQQVVQQLNVAAPLNDLQIIALMAAQLSNIPAESTAADRVGLATDILAEVFAQMNNGEINRKIKER